MFMHAFICSGNVISCGLKVKINKRRISKPSSPKFFFRSSSLLQFLIISLIDGSVAKKCSKSEFSKFGQGSKKNLGELSILNAAEANEMIRSAAHGSRLISPITFVPSPNSLKENWHLSQHDGLSICKWKFTFSLWKSAIDKVFSSFINIK